MALPYTIDSLLAKQNLFYNECNEVAQTIADEIVEADRHNEEDEDLTEFIVEQVRDHVNDMMTAYAEDLINSYGITRALEVYIKEQGTVSTWTIVHGMLLCIITDPIISRVQGILLEHRRSLQRSSS